MTGLPSATPPAKGHPRDPRNWSLAVVRARPGGFEYAYDAFYGEVADYVLRRTGDAHVTQDLVADIFLSALSGLPRARNPEAPFRFWLFRIAINRVNRWWASTQRRERLQALLNRTRAEDPAPAEHASPETERLMRTLRRLSPAHVTVLTLHYLQELSIEQIADVLECAPGTVKSRLARARASFLESEQRNPS